MTERNLAGKAKMGLCRIGRRVYLIFEFPTEYEAMQAFDVWSMEDIDISFKGPKKLTETDASDLDERP